MDNQNGSEITGTIKHMKKNGTLWIVLIGLCLGVGLLVFGSFNLSEKNKNTADSKGSDGGICLTLSEYENIIEKDVEELCKKVYGVTAVCVSVRVESGVEYVYATNVQSNNSGEKSEYVIIGSGSNAHALYICERPPKIGGIGIVFRGEDSIGVRNELLSLVSAAYGIPMNKIYVTHGDPDS